MSLNDAAKAAAVKKVTLLDESFARFAVRATLAGVYLCIGTAFAGVVARPSTALRRVWAPWLLPYFSA